MTKSCPAPLLSTPPMSLSFQWLTLPVEPLCTSFEKPRVPLKPLPLSSATGFAGMAFPPKYHQASMAPSRQKSLNSSAGPSALKTVCSLQCISPGHKHTSRIETRSLVRPSVTQSLRETYTMTLTLNCTWLKLKSKQTSWSPLTASQHLRDAVAKPLAL